MGKDQAVQNPLAQDIAQAVSQLGVAGQVVFEPGKVHPKDWANPGRVRVLIKEDGKMVGPGGIKNSTSILLFGKWALCPAQPTAVVRHYICIPY